MVVSSITAALAHVNPPPQTPSWQEILGRIESVRTEILTLGVAAATMGWLLSALYEEKLACEKAEINASSPPLRTTQSPLYQN